MWHCICTILLVTKWFFQLEHVCLCDNQWNNICVNKNNSLGPLSLTAYPFWPIWRNKKWQKSTIHASKDTSFPLTDDYDWDLSSRAMVNDDSQSRVFTLMATGGQWCEAICPEQICPGPLEAPLNWHWQNLWGAFCIMVVKEQRKLQSKKEGCLLKTRKWDSRMPTAHHQGSVQTAL